MMLRAGLDTGCVRNTDYIGRCAKGAKNIGG